MDVTIPSVGESITSAFLSTWHIADGAGVKKGDLLLTIETDKISTEITAEAEGVLKITTAEGEEVPIGTVVGSIEEGAVSEPTASEPAEAAKDTEDKKEAQEAVAESKVEEAAAPEKEPAAVAEKAEAPAPTVPTPEPSKSISDPASTERVTRSKMSPLRRKIAAQLVAAQHEAAILSTFNEVDMSNLLALRKQVQEKFVETHGVKLGFMSLFIKAVVQALQEVPNINSQIDGDELVKNNYFDIGVAVGTEKGLVVPVVRDCDQKSCAEIEQDIVAVATRAREGKLQIEELQGGVFTISNGGIYGSLLSTPILNRPQSGILGMHTIQERPIAVDGEVVIRPMMYLALSYDHRVVDGKEAVTFLISVKEAIEAPARLLTA